MPTKWVAKARVRRALSALIRNEGSALPQRLWSARTFDGGREKAPAAICREVIAAKLSGKHAFNQISGSSNVTIRPIYQEGNKGKGGGLRTGFAAVTGDVLVIQRRRC